MSKSIALKYFSLLAVLFIYSCSGNEDQKDAESKNVDSNSIEASDTIVETRPNNLEEIEEIETRLEENENSLDSIKAVVKKWNNGINTANKASLNEVYASSVDYYLSTKSKEDIVASKLAWLAKNAGYSQSYSIQEVQYPSSHDGLIRVVLDKELKYTNKTETIISIVEMRYADREYLITKETDQVTEIRKAKEAKSSILNKGEIWFDNHRWVDMRDNDALGHSFVPYYITIGVTLGDSLEIYMSRYSGSLREVRPYKVRKAEYDTNTGFLTFEAAMNFAIDMGGEEIPERLPKDEDYEKFVFKTFDGYMTLLTGEDWYKELEGTRFWKLTD